MNYTYEFIAKLAKFDWLSAPEVSLESDGDVGFDWLTRRGTVSAHIRENGRAGYAALVNGCGSYGSFQWPDWPEALTEALRKVSE